MIQKLYNELFFKNESRKQDSFVLRVSLEEMKLILLGLKQIGADEVLAIQYSDNLQEEISKTLDEKTKKIEETIREAYVGLRAKVSSGKYKDWVGYISLNSSEKKPFLITFADGSSQKYGWQQFDVIDKDREKLLAAFK